MCRPGEKERLLARTDTERDWSGKWSGHINHGASGTSIYEALYRGEPTGITLRRTSTKRGKPISEVYLAPNGDEYDVMTQPGGPPLQAWLEAHRPIKEATP